jgi:hypothetical protein
LPEPVFKNLNCELFQLSLTNMAQSDVNLLCLDTVRLRITDKQGDPIAASEVVDISTIAFFDIGTELSSVVANDDTLTFIFGENTIAVGETWTIALRADILADIASAFGIVLDTSGISATYIDGPALGEQVMVTAPPNGGSILKKTFEVAGPSLEQSFMIEDNPWHPGSGVARFAYTLVEESILDFRIFTLGGELVLNRRIEASSPLAAPGPHIIEWDGLNGAGVMVHDGVYIVSLLVTRTGEEARLKVAVLK